MHAIGNINLVRAALLLRGYRSLAEWARQHGHKENTVLRVVYTWGQRSDRPLGGLGRQIMRDLRATLANTPIEEIEEHAA